MLIYGKYVDGPGIQKFELDCICGERLGTVDQLELDAIHGGQFLTVVENYFDGVYCVECQIEMMTNLSSQEYYELEQARLDNPELLFSSVPGMDTSISKKMSYANQLQFFSVGKSTKGGNYDE